MWSGRRDLQMKQAGNDLQTVLHPMMDFMEQHFSLRKRLGEPTIGLLVFGHVLQEAREPLDRPLSIFNRKRLGFDPSNLAIGANDSVFELHRHATTDRLPLSLKVLPVLGVNEAVPVLIADD